MIWYESKWEKLNFNDFELRCKFKDIKKECFLMK